MFIDIAKIRIKAGRGGDGAVSFRREKYVAAGGPDGGDGGRGGDVVFVADDNLSTLMDFRYKTKYQAPAGENGRGARCNGKKAADLVIRVPRGTLVREATSGALMADISGDEPVVLARGGRGGWGNTHFATPTRQIPRFAKPGMPGEEFEVQLELKLIADVGLIGFPNVGKSTLLSVISAARPKIANYHFTTLSPVLGVVRVDEQASFVAADIPGLIEGAADGVGLGHDFLRHVERCRLLLHVVDAAGSEGRDPIEDLKKIDSELTLFSPALAERPQLVLGNKCDIATPEQIARLRAYAESLGRPFFAISAATRQGLEGLPGLVYKELQNLPKMECFIPDFVRETPTEGGNRFTVTRLDEHVFDVDAPWLERILAGSDVEDYESLQYFQRQLADSGVLAELVRQGVQEDDTICIGEYQFDYIF